MEEELSRKLDNYCLVTGTSREDAVNKAVSNLITPYQCDMKMPIRAVYDHDTANTRCWILGKRKMWGKPFYRIVLDKEILMVPEDWVTL